MRFVVIVLSLFLSTCGIGTSNDFKPLAAKPGMAIVYVYSNPGQLLRTQGFSSVTLNGKPIGKLGAGFHYKRTVKQGVHSVGFTYGFKKRSIPFKANAGQTYYFRMYVSNEQISIQPVSAAVGAEEIIKTSNAV